MTVINIVPQTTAAGQSQSQPEQQQQQNENETFFGFLCNLIQDLLFCALFLGISLLILVTFVYFFDGLAAETKRDCRWPKEWCEQIFKCKRNGTNIDYVYEILIAQRHAEERMEYNKNMMILID